MVENLETVTEM